MLFFCVGDYKQILFKAKRFVEKHKSKHYYHGQKYTVYKSTNTKHQADCMDIEALLLEGTEKRPKQDLE